MSPLWLLVGLLVGFLFGWGVRWEQDWHDAITRMQIRVALRDGPANANLVFDRISLMDESSPPNVQRIIALLRGLEQEGWIASEVVPGGPERGYRDKYLYRLVAPDA